MFTINAINKSNVFCKTSLSLGSIKYDFSQSLFNTSELKYFPISYLPIPEIAIRALKSKIRLNVNMGLPYQHISIYLLKYSKGLQCF